MGILRADLLTHSQLESAGGSVVFDGSGDYLTIPNHSAFHFTGDYTIDFYIKFSTFSGTQRIFGQRNSDASDLSVLGEFASNNFYYYYSQNGTNSENIIIGSSGSSDETKNLELNTWYHVAIVSNGGVHHSYLNGVQTAVNVNNPPPLNDGDSTWSIGRQGAFTSNEFSGSIYGFRITTGALYKNNFTVSKFKPKVLPGTLLLCCVSSTSVTEAEVSVAGDITSNGDPQIGDTPLLKEDITDTGVVFDGFTVLATSTYMVPPGGNTRERNRGRGLITGGATGSPSTNVTLIKYFDIASGGITDDFGNLTAARRGIGSFASSTRACAGGGFVAPTSPTHTVLNTIDFVTIANTANATDFGDMQQTGYSYATSSNQTRGLFAGGYRPNNSAVVNTIDLITIATTGNASNFGDLTRTARSFNGAASTTRGVFFGGAPSTQDTIDFVTFSTTGDATDFGNLTVGRDIIAGSSSNIRAVMGGGRTPSNSNIIDYITIASTGDATDFGDLIAANYYYAATGNSTRAVWASDGSTNVMEFVTIATTGNASDFGDQNGTPQHLAGVTSDSHGGLS